MEIKKLRQDLHMKVMQEYNRIPIVERPLNWLAEFMSKYKHENKLQR